MYRRTEGNPLFVEALLSGGELDSGLPESLRDLLVAAVRRLPEETQELVRVASAAGARVGHPLLGPARPAGQDLARPRQWHRGSRGRGGGSQPGRSAAAAAGTDRT